MDPNATLQAIADAIADGDVITARERMADLDEWIDKGGFVPVDYARLVERFEAFELETEELINALHTNPWDRS